MILIPYTTQASKNGHNPYLLKKGVFLCKVNNADLNGLTKVLDILVFHSEVKPLDIVRAIRVISQENLVVVLSCLRSLWV